jgi:hypothetical protein
MLSITAISFYFTLTAFMAVHAHRTGMIQNRFRSVVSLTFSLYLYANFFPVIGWGVCAIILVMLVGITLIASIIGLFIPKEKLEHENKKMDYKLSYDVIETIVLGCILTLAYCSGLYTPAFKFLGM